MFDHRPLDARVLGRRQRRIEVDNAGAESGEAVALGDVVKILHVDRRDSPSELVKDGGGVGTAHRHPPDVDREVEVGRIGVVREDIEGVFAINHVSEFVLMVMVAELKARFFQLRAGSVIDLGFGEEDVAVVGV